MHATFRTALCAARTTLCTALALSTPTLPSIAIATTAANSHAPIGVMGDHTHPIGEFMFSYRYMHMDMQGNRDGSSSISPDAIVTRAPNRFTGAPMQAPTLRVVPTKMSMDMHMLGAMYAPHQRITLMAMANYIEKDMDHVTFKGASGTTRLGNFTTRTSGIGDTRLSALVKLDNHWHTTLGISLPTGDIKETGRILTPMNTRPKVRLPYPMQLGSGSWDVIAGLTYTVHHQRWGWGSQWQSVFRTGDNSENYTLGDEHRVTGWLNYNLKKSVSLSARAAYLDRGNIDGRDTRIMLPVQTADPDRQALKQWEFALGVNWLLPGDQHRVALEFSAPIARHTDGPQLEIDEQLTLGWQFTP